MPTTTMPSSANMNYESRWFIWTIVFLVVTGISLVSYIALSDTGSADDSGVVASAHTTTHKTTTTVKK